VVLADAAIVTASVLADAATGTLTAIESEPSMTLSSGMKPAANRGRAPHRSRNPILRTAQTAYLEWRKNLGSRPLDDSGAEENPAVG
jgi:hypothetical protein